ncbi:uncharacterized protein N7483_006895 [Penicillium malachiteum]|uniref:uncharacterized protein n=1 Tax=Penicillium malachiteum TaxID=1324776 RepID=UPI002549A162|nr:uncharacterized protein N7483_006895 [Penicillium malachiteum]KAJ5725538.1 hypothetical protein N7483_006895 [Penicillium malachiteum]
MPIDPEPTALRYMLDTEPTNITSLAVRWTKTLRKVPRASSRVPRNRYLEGLVEQLSASNGKITESDSSQGASSSTLDHSRGSTFRVAQYTNLNQDDMLNICYTGTAAYPTLLNSQPSLEAYQTSTVHGLPDEQIAHYAVDGFFRCAATLFFIKTHDEALELLYRVYQDENVSVGDMSEFCALAAIRSHYDAERVPQEARAVFFYRASIVLNGIVPLESVQRVRVFICLCMNCIMDKSTTARTLIGKH